MENLQVEVDLKTPVAISHPWINIDGLIHHLEAVEEYGRNYLELISRSVIQSPLDLDLDPPLEVTDEIYHASISFFDCSEMNVFKIYKRYDKKRSHEVSSSRPRKKIRLGSGEFKNEIITLSYYPASKCYFFLKGDRDELESLFNKHMTGLGKKIAAGFGIINSIEVKEINEDNSIIQNGKAMRPIPVDKLSNWSDSEYISWRSPYWADENHARCAPPGAEVEF